MTARLRSPVFILTLPRSGSTLLRFLLDSHSHITCPPETQMALLCSNVLTQEDLILIWATLDLFPLMRLYM